MKRIVLAAFNISENKLYDYQLFIISEVKKIADKLILLCSSELDTNNTKIINNKGIDIIYSHYNIDVYMWRDFIINNNNILKNYDSLILLNDSFFGPVYPLEDVFLDMENRKVDFWGITLHEPINSNGIIFPEFIQRYFTVFNNKLIKNRDFISFWKQLGKKENVEFAEKKYEFVFKDFFEKKGYIGDCYCRNYHDKNNPNAFISDILFRPYELLEEKKNPFVSRYLFCVSRDVELNYNFGNEAENVLEFLKEKTTYDISLIFDYIIKNSSPFELWTKINASYIIDKEWCKEEEFNCNAVLVAHLFYIDLLDNSIEYLKNVPEWIDIIITVNYDEIFELVNEKCKKMKNCKVFKVSSRGREWSALLIGIKDELINYDYIGFIHDKKSKQMYYSTVGESFNRYLWDNMLASKEYIINSLRKFEENTTLGILLPNVVYHGEFWRHYGTFWTICYNETVKLADLIGLNDIPDCSTPVLSIGSCFWARKEAIKKLLDTNFVEENFPEEPIDIDGTLNHALERILCYVVKDSGYYTGTLLQKKYAENNLTNFEYIIRSALKEINNKNLLDTTTVHSMLYSLKQINDKNN